MKNKDYVYEGPLYWKSRVGQVMAYLGYHQAKEASLVLRFLEEEDRYTVLVIWQGKQVKIEGSSFEEIRHGLIRYMKERDGQVLNEWGYLTGVRPVKLAHRLLDTGYGYEEGVAYLQERYALGEKKAALLMEIALRQRPYIWDGTGDDKQYRSVSYYIGIPYCPSHCVYCSFPSLLVGKESAAGLVAFTKALIEDMKEGAQTAQELGLNLDTIYIGGGTPTCLPYPALEQILKAVATYLPNCTEYTVEAGRPDTASKEVLALLKEYGVQRISVNPQTMQDRLLQKMGRRHGVDDIYRMYEAAQSLGLEVNMDFIAGLPGQTVKDMAENIEIVCKLAPENVTIHTLSLKKGAPLYDHPLRAELPSVEEVEAMLQVAGRLRFHGYEPYYGYRQTYMTGNFENIGYGRDSHWCRYNIQMMEERQTVIGIGPGSSTKIIRQNKTLEKVYMPKSIATYVEEWKEGSRKRRESIRNVYKGGEGL